MTDRPAATVTRPADERGPGLARPSTIEPARRPAPPLASMPAALEAPSGPAPGSGPDSPAPASGPVPAPGPDEAGSGAPTGPEPFPDEPADSAVAPRTEPPAPSAPDAQAERRFVDLINQERAQAGLPALAVRPGMQAVADRWSRVVVGPAGACEIDGLKHNPDYAREVPEGWSLLAENVACGATVDLIHQAFMTSAGHRANILDLAFTDVGVGVEIAADGTLWVTQNFGRY